MAIPPIKFAAELEVGDIIETGCCVGDRAELIAIQHFTNVIALRWGVGPGDCKTVSPFTGVVFHGRFEPVIRV